eukprot:Skav235804  [mRNA]  locus=scaffold1267:220870:244127:- [translate_table: standard]
MCPGPRTQSPLGRACCGYEATPWTYRPTTSAPGGGDLLIATTPVIYMQQVHFGTEAGRFIAVAQQNGSWVWEVTTGGRLRSSPTVSDNVIFFGSGDGKLRAINARGAIPVWEFDANASVETCPTVNDRCMACRAGLLGHNFVTFDLTQDGKKIWEFQAGGAVRSSAALSDGELSWRFNASGPVRTEPILHFDQAFFGSGAGIFYAISERKGTENWRFDAKSPIYSSAAVHRGFVYFGCDDGMMYALDELTGAMIWSYNAFSPIRTAKAPAMDASQIFFGTEDGKLHAVSDLTGEKNWDFQSNGPVTAAPGHQLELRIGSEVTAGGQLRKRNQPLAVVLRNDEHGQWEQAVGETQSMEKAMPVAMFAQHLPEEDITVAFPELRLYCLEIEEELDIDKSASRRGTGTGDGHEMGAEYKKRKAFFDNANWDGLEKLFVGAGLLKKQNGPHDPERRTLAMLVLMTIHDLMKLDKLRPIVSATKIFNGYKKGEQILALELAVRTASTKTSSDVAFYFVHWKKRSFFQYGSDCINFFTPRSPYGVGFPCCLAETVRAWMRCKGHDVQHAHISEPDEWFLGMMEPPPEGHLAPRNDFLRLTWNDGDPKKGLFYQYLVRRVAIKEKCSKCVQKVQPAYDELLNRATRPTVPGVCCNLFLCNIPDAETRHEFGLVLMSQGDALEVLRCFSCLAALEPWPCPWFAAVDVVLSS